MHVKRTHRHNLLKQPLTHSPLLLCVCVRVVVGHMMVYPLVLDLVAETDAEKARVVRLIRNTMHYIVQNGFYLIDVTGQPTQYASSSTLRGDLDPER